MVKTPCFHCRGRGFHPWLGKSHMPYSVGQRGGAVILIHARLIVKRAITFHRTRKKIFTICVETQKTPNSQSNLENEKWSWGNQAP